MQLFGTTHLTLLALIAVLGTTLAWACRTCLLPSRPVRLTFGFALAANELIWWIFRYSHEGFHFPRNLPLQLCDVTVWMTVAACLTLKPWVVEFDYFAGLAGAGMALITPDLWTPWPSYPAIYFFLAHGGIVIGIGVVVFGGMAPLRPGAVWRAFGGLLCYAALLGAFNAVFHTNYMYLCTRPASASVLDAFGKWPFYLIEAAGLTLAIYGLLWLPGRASSTGRGSYAGSALR
jgi:hypothetical integral membrane protein (TIGR02206 family)